MRKLAPALVCVALAAAAAEARAQQPPPADDLTRARELFREGSTLAEAGDWDGARDRFERSVKLKRAALTFYNLGIAEEETGHLVDAIDSFHAFLAQPLEPATQRYVDPVKAALTKLEARVARVSVEVRPPELTNSFVFIDGRDVTALPRPWAVDPGTHQLSVVSPGFAEARQTTTLGDAGRLTLVITLEPRSTSAGPPRIGRAAPLALAIGGGAAFVAGGVIFGIGAHQQLSSHPDAAGTRATVAGAVVGGVGLGVGGAGLGLLVVTRRSDHRPDVTLTPWFTGSAGGLRLAF
jgi:hypothetical protein